MEENGATQGHPIGPVLVVLVPDIDLVAIVINLVFLLEVMDVVHVQPYFMVAPGVVVEVDFVLFKSCSFVQANHADVVDRLIYFIRHETYLSHRPRIAFLRRCQ